MNHSVYPHLFEPLRVGSIMLKNRIISAPLGSLTDKSVSGIGMIIRGTSGCVNDGRSRIAPGPYCFATPALAAKLMEEASIIRQRGAKAEYELCHVGQFAKDPLDGYAIGPVGFTRDDGTVVRAMEEAMMDYVADKFAEGALDAKEYGFDMVMLHFGHGWLPAQFLSPHFNKRTDEYGGSFANRIKFPTMIVERVRRAVGPGYPLDMRISGYEHVAGGIPTAEVAAFVASVQDKIDMVHISCGIERYIETNVLMSSTPFVGHMCNVSLAQQVKASVNIPVAVVGAIMTPEEGEQILAEGKADAIVIGRSVIADPFWVQKAWEGRAEDIVPCLRCLKCYAQYSDVPTKGRRGIAGCSVNPRYLRESRVPVGLAKAPKKKTVVVVGGGPAGMKAALTADERGHRVILLEKQEALGGQARCADHDPYKQDLQRYKDYLVCQMGKSGVEVRLNTAATPDMVKKLAPQSLVVAVGASPALPPIKGIEAPHVMTAVEAYFKQDAIGDRVTIIGGGAIGCELALLLCESGRQVHVIELAAGLNAQSNAHLQVGLAQKLRRCKGLTCLTKTTCQAIGKTEVTVQTKGQGEAVIATDTVIIAAGMRAEQALAQSFFGLVQDTNLIGDCNIPGTIEEATNEGYFVCASL